ncbi:MAG: ACP S-malonyltransferase [Proteobacteria bacterium]|nr:ACP S-malonyltransferase [Pseudomonadota bacterium]
MKRAFVFPGQGSQAVGMGRSLAEAYPVARQVFEEVDDALGFYLSRLIFEGPPEDLMLTANAQPALMAVSLATARTVEKEGRLRLADAAAFVAGHSLGEYSALCAVGALSLADTARLLRHRGEVMQAAVPLGEGAMLALLGVGLEAARRIADQASQGEICTPANDNGPNQVVLSGHKAAIERAQKIVAEEAAGRSSLLPVSAPFHCRLMEPAAEAMAQVLEKITIAPLALPLIANMTASAVGEPAIIRRLLVEQVTGMVRWRESMFYLRDHEVESVAELGAGKVLSGLLRRIDRGLEAITVGSPAEVETFLKSL